MLVHVVGYAWNNGMSRDGAGMERNEVVRFCLRIFSGGGMRSRFCSRWKGAGGRVLLIIGMRVNTFLETLQTGSTRPCS